MKAYLDSSVILRFVLGEPGRLAEWRRIDAAYTSEIASVECLRTLDRLRLSGGMSDRELARRRATLMEVLEGLDQLRLNRAVLDRASDAFPSQVRTLDALHLASASLVRARVPSLRFATHDAELGAAAAGMGFLVVGLQRRRD